MRTRARRHPVNFSGCNCPNLMSNVRFSLSGRDRARVGDILVGHHYARVDCRSRSCAN